MNKQNQKKKFHQIKKSTLKIIKNFPTLSYKRRSKVFRLHRNED
jgi:hypothetical protein